MISLSGISRSWRNLPGGQTPAAAAGLCSQLRAGVQLRGCMSLLTGPGFEIFRCSASTSIQESRTRIVWRVICLWAPSHSIWSCVELLVSGDRAKVPELPRDQ